MPQCSVCHVDRRASERAHVPINYSRLAARSQRAGGPIEKRKRGGRCCLHGECAAGEPKRPTHFCPGCKHRGGSGWYHEACYWRRHNAVLIDDGARAYDCNEA